MKKNLFLSIVALLLLFPRMGKSQCSGISSVNGTTVQTLDQTVNVAGRTTAGAIYPIEIVFNSSFSSVSAANISAVKTYVEGVWGSKLLSSDITGALKIRVLVGFPDKGYSSTGAFPLGEEFCNVFHDFGCGTPSNVLYNQSLVNFIYDQYNHTAGRHNTDWDMIININSNSNIHWNYNPTSCPPGEFDFATVLLHEIGHGLGITSSAEQISSTTIGLTMQNGNTGTPASYNNMPSIFDWYVNDNGTGHTSAGYCTFDVIPLNFEFIENPTTGFQNYCIGAGGYADCDATTSNQLYLDCSYWSGAWGLPIPKLYVPNPFVSQSSICHLDETFPVTASGNNELMQPAGLPSNILQPSKNDVSILSAIGWATESSSGTGDYVALADPSSGCHGTPNQVFNLGVANNYCQGGSFTPDPTNAGWYLGLYDENGDIHTMHTQSTGATWSPTISSGDLPSGVIWYRDANGRIPGILTYTNSVSSNTYSSEIGIGLNYAPQNIQFSLANASSNSCNCDQEKLQFFAPGATSYSVAKRIYDASTGWGGWIPSTGGTPVTTGQLEYTYSSLSQDNDYEFQVIASNSSGSITSNILTRHHCYNAVVASPDPISSSSSSHIMSMLINPPSGVDGDDGTLSGTDATLGMDGVTGYTVTPIYNPCSGNANPFNVTSVTLVNIANPVYSYTFSFDGTSTSATIDVSSITAGIYALTVYSSGSNESASAQVEIDN